MHIRSALEIVAYLTLAPVFGILLNYFERVFSCFLAGVEKPNFLITLKDTIALVRGMPLQKDEKTSWMPIAYLIANIGCGLVLFSGGEITLSILLFALANLFQLYGRFSSRDDSKKMGLEMDAGREAVLTVQLLMVSIGISQVVNFFTGAYSFRLNAILDLEGAAVYYLPGLLVGLGMMVILFSKRSFFTTIQGKEDNVSGNQLFLELGRFYELFFLLYLVFLFHFAGTAITAMIGLAACIVILFLRMIASGFVEKRLSITAIIAVFFIIQIVSLLNIIGMIKA